MDSVELSIITYINLVCGTCGSNLNGVDRGFESIEVEVCQTCIDEIRDDKELK
jgi:hypothetical protein